MFKEICNKLCSITDELAKRQQDLLNMAQNSSIDEQSAAEIMRISSVGIRLRNREEFAKLVDQHFSENDATVDFSLFSEDIKGIKEKIQESNELIQVAREESAKDRENRDRLLERIENIENSTNFLRNETEQKINELKWNVQVRANQLALKSDLEHLGNFVRVIEERVNRNDQFTEEFNEKVFSIRQGTIQQNEEVKKQERQNLESIQIFFKRFEEFNAGIQKNLADFIANQNRQNIEYDRSRNESMKKTQEAFNNEFKLKSDKDLKIINDFNKKMKNEFDNTKNWLESRMLDFENNFKDKVRKEVEDFQEGKRTEEIRNEKERLKILNQEALKKQKEEERRLAEEKKKEEQAKKEAEEKRKKQEEDKKSQIYLENLKILSLDEKKAHFMWLNLEKYQIIANCRWPIHEINISNDGKYVFVCILHSGIS